MKYAPIYRDNCAVLFEKKGKKTTEFGILYLPYFYMYIANLLQLLYYNYSVVFALLHHIPLTLQWKLLKFLTIIQTLI